MDGLLSTFLSSAVWPWSYWWQALCGGEGGELERWARSGSPADKSPAVERAVEIDSETELVDRHMMVIPAKGDQVVGIVVAAVVLFRDVVRLQPMTAAASFDGALSSVPFEDEGPNRGWNCLSSMRNREWAVAVGVDDPSAPAAKNLGKRVRPDAESAARGGAGFSVGRCGH